MITKFEKLAIRLQAISGNRFVYTLVPKKAVDAVMTDGLLSSKALLDRPDLMELSKHPGETVKVWQNKIRRDLKDDFRQPSMLGPSVFFHLPPKNLKLNKKHPTKLYDLVLLKINLGQLMKDIPETKVFGMELEPFDEQDPDKVRHRYINDKELDDYINMSAEENWKYYADLDDKGLYAPNVPHASLHVPGGIVPAKYISR